MSSWARSARSRRRLGHLSRGGAKPFRPFRSQPYPGPEEKAVLQQDAEGFENVAQSKDYAIPTDYKPFEPSPHEPNVKPMKEGDKRSALYQRFYQHFHGDGAKQPADCVVLSLNNQELDYAKSLGHCLQERGLLVEMLYLQSESGLTQALKDVRADGSLLCILIEQTNVELSSCTVIIFSESLKSSGRIGCSVHRNMPREQALDLVMVEYGCANGARRQCDSAEAAARASELSNDYQERAKLERHAVPSATRHLFLLMAEGLHLYPEELDSIAAYVHNRQDHLQATSDKVETVAPEAKERHPAALGNPPPLLPKPVGSVPPLAEHPTSSTDTGKPAHGHRMSTSDSYPKTKPPPLLSLNHLQGSPQGHPPQDPPLHGPTGSRAPSSSRGPPASESRSLLYGPPPLHGPPVPNGPPRAHALCGPSPPHGPAAHHSFSASRNPQPVSGPTALKAPPDSHAAHPPRPHNGPHGFHIRSPPPPRGPLLQNGPSGLRAPPPLLRNPRIKNPAGAAAHTLRHPPPR